VLVRTDIPPPETRSASYVRSTRGSTNHANTAAATAQTAASQAVRLPRSLARTAIDTAMKAGKPVRARPARLAQRRPEMVRRQIG
jgi:2-oxoglutarate dehydrogenase complex dehydrogenase (E1) component-like enzyme